MRRSGFVLTSAFAAVGLSALSAPAQPAQRVANPSGASSSAAAAADPAADALNASRPARYLLRNGQDYLSYREYDRSLHFFRLVENRQKELTDAERQQLRQGIARAQQGKREAINAPHVVAQPKGRPSNPPGSFALAQAQPPAQPRSARPAVAVQRPMAPDPVQLTSATVTEPAPAPMMVAPVSTPSPAVASVPSEPAPLDMPSASTLPTPPPVGPDGMELPTVPSAAPASLPDLGSSPSDAAPLPVAPAGEAAPAPVVESAAPSELPALGGTDAAVNPVALPAEAAASAPANEMPVSAPAPEPAPDPAQTPAPPQTSTPAPAPVEDPAPAQGQPVPATETLPPVAEASPAPAATGSVGVDPYRALGTAASPPSTPDSFLTPRHREEIEKLAQRGGEGNPANERASAANPTNDPNGPTGLTQGSTRLELLRPPSPTEAQPIRRIPVPEEFVPLDRRDWNANRKYWAAAGTCHMTLYFQDPVLERYGQGVEQALGPRGRYFSYPLDDPKQSNQRNQILQPFYSIGKFCFQVGSLPYKLVVDPPWEAEYDLGYYRPGDKIPPDTIMITPTGVGPPLKGRKY